MADNDNPLVHPDANPPGVKMAPANELHQNAVEQEYNTAGGKRKLGQAKPVAYKKVANPTASSTPTPDASAPRPTSPGAAAR